MPNTTFNISFFPFFECIFLRSYSECKFYILMSGHHQPAYKDTRRLITLLQVLILVRLVMSVLSRVWLVFRPSLNSQSYRSYWFFCLNCLQNSFFSIEALEILSCWYNQKLVLRYNSYSSRQQIVSKVNVFAYHSMCQFFFILVML